MDKAIKKTDSSFVDTVIGWGLPVTAAAIPMIWLPLNIETPDPLILGYLFPKALALRIFSLALLLLFAVKIARQRPVQLSLGLTDAAFAGFLATATAAAFFSLDRRLALFGGPISLEGLFTYVNYAFLFWLAKQYGEPRLMDRLLKAVVITTTLVSLAAVIEIKTGVFPGPAAVGRLSMGPAGNAVTIDGLLVLVMPLLVGALLVRGPTRLWTVGAFSAATLGTAVLILSETPVAQIAAGAGFALLLILSRRRGGLNAKRLPLAVAVLVLGAAISLVPSAAAPQEPAEGSPAHLIGTADRRQIWRQTVIMVPKYAAAGAGLDNYGPALEKELPKQKNLIPAEKPFSIWLELLIGTGVLGLVFYLIFYVSLFVALVKGAKKTGAALIAPAAAVFSYGLFLSLFFSTLNTAPLFFVLAGAGLGCAERAGAVRKLRLFSLL